MGTSNALFTGLTGLLSNQRRLDVIGNNIANVGTTSFKSSRMLFSTLYAQTRSPIRSGLSGGTNPMQVGSGAMIAGTQRNFAGGATATGIATDMAIDGDGFFIAQMNGDTLYTRDGTFSSTRTGVRHRASVYVMGWGVDDQSNIIGGQLQSLAIPLGMLRRRRPLGTSTSMVRSMRQGISPPQDDSPSTALFTDTDLAAALPWTWDPGGTRWPVRSVDLTLAGNNLYVDDGDGIAQLAIEGGAQAMITIDGIEKNGQSIVHSFLSNRGAGDRGRCERLGFDHVRFHGMARDRAWSDQRGHFRSDTGWSGGDRPRWLAADHGQRGHGSGSRSVQRRYHGQLHRRFAR